MPLSSLQSQIAEWAHQKVSLTIQDTLLIIRLGEIQYALTSPESLIEDKLQIEFLPNDGFQIRHKRHLLACFLEKSPYSYSNDTVFSKGVFPLENESVRQLHFFQTSQAIDLDRCTQYTNLSHLSIRHCETSSTLPALPKLNSIHFQYCNDIVDIQNLALSQELSSLKLQWCPNIETVPSQISSSLETLLVEWCPHIENIFAFDFPLLRRCSLASLKHLDFQSLSNSEQLEYLSIAWFKKNIHLPDLSSCNALKKLCLRSLSEVQNLPILPKNGVLEELDCSEMYSLTQVALPPSPHLHSLNVDGCVKLEAIDLSSLRVLQRLSALRVPSLRDIKGLTNQHSLKELDISDSAHLSHLEGLESHQRLQTLSLNNCSSIQTLPSLDKFPLLQKLKVYNCDDLIALDSLKQEKLNSFLIGGCRSLQRIPALKNLPNLNELSIAWFHSKTPIDDVSNLKHLQRLRLSGHSGLRALRLSGLTKLKDLDCSRCRHLEIIDASDSTLLEKVSTQECISLRRFKGFENIRSIVEGLFSNCQSLENIDFLYFQPNLRRLDISGCQSLKRLPSFHPKTLQSLHSLNLSHRPYPTDLSKLVSEYVGIRVLNLEGTTNIYEMCALTHLRNLRELYGVSPSQRDHILCQIFLRFDNIGAMSSHLKGFLESLQRSQVISQFAYHIVDAMNLTNAPIEQWKYLFHLLQKKERFALGDSPVTEKLWRHFFLRLDQQRFPDVLLSDFISSHSSFDQDGNCLRSLLDVLFQGEHFDKEEVSLLFEQTYLQSSPLQQRLYRSRREQWQEYLPEIAQPSIERQTNAH